MIRAAAFLTSCCLLTTLQAEQLSGQPQLDDAQGEVRVRGALLRLLITPAELRQLLPGVEEWLAVEGVRDRSGRLIARQLSTGPQRSNLWRLSLEQLDDVRLEANGSQPPVIVNGKERLPTVFSAMAAVLREQVRQNPGRQHSLVGYRVENPTGAEFYPVLVRAKIGLLQGWAEAHSVGRMRLDDVVAPNQQLELGRPEAPGLTPRLRGFSQVLTPPAARSADVRELACEAVDALVEGDDRPLRRTRKELETVSRDFDEETEVREEARRGLDRLQWAQQSHNLGRPLPVCGLEELGPFTTMEEGLEHARQAAGVLANPGLTPARRAKIKEQGLGAARRVLFDPASSIEARQEAASLEARLTGLD